MFMHDHAAEREAMRAGSGDEPSGPAVGQRTRRSTSRNRAKGTPTAFATVRREAVPPPWPVDDRVLDVWLDALAPGRPHDAADRAATNTRRPRPAGSTPDQLLLGAVI